MIRIISALGCTSCRLREPCRTQAGRSPWLLEGIGSLRKECRIFRLELAVFAIAGMALLLAALIVPVFDRL